MHNEEDSQPHSDSQDSQYNDQSSSQSPNLDHLAPQQAQQENKQMSNNPPAMQIMPSAPLAAIRLASGPSNESRPRLIIDKIVLENFKSYADKQVIGPFHENFTSVVGPNGSGKSNLIESMLFIFGYKANWMRLNRLNQLIHNSSTVSQVEKAAVQVQFKKIIQDQHDQVKEVQGGFSLRRVVKMSGISKYYINNKESTQAQVKDRLKQEGIDLNNNRFLILQGEVQQISQMKQKSGDRDKPGLLEYLEDIIGSNVFIDQIEASVQEYNSIEQTKHQKGQLMKVAESQLKNMSKGKDQAIRYVKKQRHIYQIHNILHQVNISNYRYEAKEHEQRLEKAEKEKDRIIREEKEKLKKQADRIREIKKYKAEIQNIQKQLAKLTQVMGKLQIADKNINQQISFRSEDLVKFGRKIKQLDTELAKIINESDEIKDQLPQSKQKLEKLRKSIGQMQQELVKYDKPELKKKIKVLENNLKKCNHQITSFEDRKKNIQKNLQNKSNKTEKLQLRKLDAEKRIQDQTQKVAKIHQAETAAVKIKDSLSEELNQISINRKRLLGELQKIDFSLKQNLNQNQQIGMFNNMFEKIMQQRIPGVIGRLGDLGSVPKQYDQIITSCCSRLDNIVVKNFEAANAVLNFLKISKLGRVSCIILDKIQQQRKFMERPWQNLPKSVRLFDLIKASSQEVRIAFYFAISDTIYCENSQLGMEYSFKDDKNRKRVVSRKPNGFIIYELNGLMNGCPARRGGFEIKAKSKMKQPQDSGQTKKLQQERNKLAEEVKGLEQRFRKVKADLQSVSKDLEQIRREKKITQSKITEANQQLSEIKAMENKGNTRMEQQKERAENEIQSIRQKLVSLKKQRDEIQEDIRKVQAEQRSHQEEKIVNLRDQYKVSKQEYEILEKEVQKKVAILQNTIKRVNQNKKSKDQLTKNSVMLEKDIQKLTKEREEIQAKATDTIAKIQQGQEKIQKCKKIEEEMKTLFDDEEKQVRQSKMKIDKARQEVDLCTNKIRVLREAIKMAEDQLQKERETYKQLSATYDFLQELENIEGMSIENVKKNVQVNKSMDSSVLLNQSISIQMGTNSGKKIFPIDKLLETGPHVNLSEDELDPFLLFTQKMRTMLVAEQQNLKKMSGNNLQIISQFRNKFADFKAKHDEYESVKKMQMELRKKIQQLKEKRLALFREGFSIINTKLKEVYQLLTKGGDAQLQLIDSLDPFSDGINFSVRPPKKAWKEINKLSGGQKTLSSLSLIFALHYYKPTPLYFMDEIDAALDFKNVSIVADYIKKRTKDAQFIIISLRNNMFQLADKLVGVYKTYDKTKIVHLIPSRTRKGVRSLDKQNLDKNQRQYENV